MSDMKDVICMGVPMTVGALKKVLEQFPDDADLFFKPRLTMGSVQKIWTVYPDVYSSFGLLVDCVILDHFDDEELQAEMAERPEDVSDD